MGEHKRRVKTAGNIEPMYVLPGIWTCGKARGLAVVFGDRAGFVIDLDDLKDIIAAAEAGRAVKARRRKRNG